jgi:DNA-binding beta-propeller fold protein YncE
MNSIHKHISVPRLFPALLLCALCVTADTANAAVGDFKYMDSITSDEDEKHLALPSFVMSDHARDEIYVVDGRARIIIYTADLFPLYTLNKLHGIEAPQGLAMDPMRNLYVAQSATKENPRPRISVFSSCLRWKKDIYPTGFEQADEFAVYRLAVDKKGSIYMAARNYPGVFVLDKNGAYIGDIVPEKAGRQVKITNVTLDKKGNIYLVSEEEGHIYVYDQERKPVLDFGEKGGSSGKLSRPKAIAVDDQRGILYVADYMRHTITVYNSKGEYLVEFGGLGWNPGWFQHPIEIAVDKSGRILVADFFNQRIQIFKSGTE